MKSLVGVLQQLTAILLTSDFDFEIGDTQEDNTAENLRSNLNELCDTCTYSFELLAPSGALVLMMC